MWRDMIARRQMGVFPYVELAKLLEHGRKDYAAALRLTEQAFSVAQPDEKEALEKRRRRLTARLAARNKINNGSGGM